jgi:hypothetical protein
MTLADALFSFPAGTTFTDAADLGTQLTEKATGSLGARGTRRVRSTVLATDARDRTGSALLNSSVSNISNISPETATTLVNAGFGTIALVSTATVAEITAAVDAAGGTVSREDVSDAVAGARLARSVRVGPG